MKIGTLLLALGVLVVLATLDHGQTPPPGVWTDPADNTLPADFQLQGEYAGASNTGITFGAQVIALGQGAFQAVVYVGGLPGAGWDGRQKTLLDGKRDGDRAVFAPTTGRRRYLAPKPEEFSAVSAFPPRGQTDCRATIVDGVVRGKTGGQTF